MPHKVLQCLGIHSRFCHIATIGVSAYMRRDIWHLHPVDVIVSADHMVETMLPVYCHKWHSIIIVKQESTISIYGLLHFLSHFLSFRQGGHTADWNYSRLSNQTLKNWHVHDIYQQIQIRIDLLLQFPTIDKMWFSINLVTYTDIFHLPLRSLPVWGLFFWNLVLSVLFCLCH